MNDKRIPYYLQLRDTIVNQITNGMMPAHSKLPSERELSNAHDMNRVTVRQSLLQLESQGLIYRLTRRGWYVSPPRFNYDPTQHISFMDNVVAQGRTPSTIILSKEEISASSKTAAHLGVQGGTFVFSLRRQRSIDVLSVLVEQITVNAALCPGLLDIPLDRSLTKIFEEHYGITIKRTTVNMYPAPLNDREAKELKVSGGTPGLFLTRSSYDADDNIIEYDEEYWRHDALAISLDVRNNH